MKFTKNEEVLNIPQPDPAWDYYTVWHSCLHIKAKIEQSLKIIEYIENATPEINKELYDSLNLISDKLVDVLNDLKPLQEQPPDES